MPVVFYVDPTFGKDPDMSDVAQLTLGYTFFRSADPQNARDLSRFLALARIDHQQLLDPLAPEPRCLTQPNAPATH